MDTGLAQDFSSLLKVRRRKSDPKPQPWVQRRLDNNGYATTLLEMLSKYHRLDKNVTPWDSDQALLRMLLE